MAEIYYAVKDSSLTKLADAVRYKANTPGQAYSIDQMVYAIRNLKLDDGGEGVVVPNKALAVHGDASYLFANGRLDWLLEQCNEHFTFNGLNGAKYMFGSFNSDQWCALTALPWDLNFGGSGADVSYMFSSGYNLTSIGSINGLYAKNMEGMFINCENLETLPTFNNFNTIWNGGACTNFKSLFFGCSKLKEIPSTLLNKLGNTSSYENPIYNSGFYNCKSLEKLNDLPTYTGGYRAYKVSTNMFVNAFYNCNSLSEITFEKNKNNGLPLDVDWCNQTIDLSQYVGYASTDIPANSVYGLASAIKTINSLPDTRYYDSTNKGTNTVKFRGASGSANGGPINTLTEEEIAVATAKGWTIAYI